jgi:hypothetical protein
MFENTRGSGFAHEERMCRLGNAHKNTRLTRSQTYKVRTVRSVHNHVYQAQMRQSVGKEGLPRGRTWHACAITHQTNLITTGGGRVPIIARATREMSTCALVGLLLYCTVP